MKKRNLVFLVLLLLFSVPQVWATMPGPPGMVWIPAGSFIMGADGGHGMPDEYPEHKVILDGYWMDVHEVTNGQFKKFVKKTGYHTTAEQKPDWNELKKQLPPNTPKPDASVLVAGSLVFTPPSQPVPLNNVAQWWQWTKGANWQHPDGPKSSIKGKDKYPATHISWDDANTFCKWAGKELPREAQWEYAARGGLKDQMFPWGDEKIDAGKPKANTWEGNFPNKNTKKDGYYGLSPAKTYPPNQYGLYDMAGNVWEWCADWYRHDYYQTANKPGGLKNPTGPKDSFDPQERQIAKRVQRGGSFMCTGQYCSGYRVSARMKASPDTSLSHSGFRCVKQQ